MIVFKVLQQRLFPVTSREFSIEVVRRLQAEGFTAYWAGGSVRDLLRQVEPHDFDVATDAPPETVRRIFGAKRTLAVGESFGVMIVLGPKTAGQVEVATFRKEGEYHDGRHPQSVEFCTAEEDALRRDFTINGMFFDPVEDRVLDFVGGQSDLEHKIVRAIGQPRDRMTEDKLRMLRGVRFAATLQFELDPITANAIREMASQIIVVSPERIAQELRKMLVDSERARAMQLCEELNLLQVILPEVIDRTLDTSLERWTESLAILRTLQSPAFETALAVLLRDLPTNNAPLRKTGPSPGSVQAVCERLRLSNLETSRTSWLVRQKGILSDFPDWSLAQQKRFAQSEFFADWLKMTQAEVTIAHQHREAFQFLRNFLADTPPEVLNPPELIDGQILIKLGLKPGPKFKNLLTAVRDAQLNNEIQTAEEALDLVKTLSSND